MWGFHSQWWVGVPCHLLVSVYSVFWSPQNLLGYSRALYASLCWQAAWRCWFLLSSRTCHKSCFNDHGVAALDWPANSPDLNAIENLWAVVKKKTRDTRHNNADDLKAAIKVTWLSMTHTQCHGLVGSMPRHIDAAIHAKGGPSEYWEHRNEQTFQRPDIRAENVGLWWYPNFLR